MQRDELLELDPDFPLGADLIPVHTNANGFCNARWWNGEIRLYRAGEGCIAMGRIPSAEALRLIVAELRKSRLQEAACAAAVAVAERIVVSEPAEVMEAMSTVLKVTDNKELLRRAKEVQSRSARSIPSPD